MKEMYVALGMHMLRKDDFLGIFKTFNDERLLILKTVKEALAVCQSFLDRVVIFLSLFDPVMLVICDASPYSQSQKPAGKKARLVVSEESQL